MSKPRRYTAILARSVESSATLIKRVASQDESAFATLYDTTCGVIYGLLLRILGDSETAEQILVAVYREVWEQAPIYADEREKPMTWLITIAHRRAVARFKADNYHDPPQASLELANRVKTPRLKTDEMSSGERNFVQAALAELSPQQQQIIELAYFSGLRQNEIATLLSVSLQSVQTGMRAGMMKLREAL